MIVIFILIQGGGRPPGTGMLICHCRCVRDSEIRALARKGADSRARIERLCGAGGDCGGCRPAIDRILDEERDRIATVAAGSESATPLVRVAATAG